MRHCVYLEMLVHGGYLGLSSIVLGLGCSRLKDSFNAFVPPRAPPFPLGGGLA